MKKLIILLIGITATMTGFSQMHSHQKTNKLKQDTTTQQYTCPMHPDVVMDKPGKCPKCGMDLQASKKEHMKMKAMKTYTCPMHQDVVSDKPGKCSKCGMDLIEVKTKEKN